MKMIWENGTLVDMELLEEIATIAKKHDKQLSLDGDGSFIISDWRDHAAAFDEIEETIKHEKIAEIEIEDITNIDFLTARGMFHNKRSHLGHKITITTEVIV